MKLSDSFVGVWAPRALSVLRIVAGFLFMGHGLQKILGFPIARSTPIDWLSLSGIAGWMELVGGALLLIGLLTRPVAFLLSGEMAVAYFMAHAPQGFWPIVNRGELAALYSFVFLYIAAAGAGPWSVDRWVRDGARLDALARNRPRREKAGASQLHNARAPMAEAGRAQGT
jgi:putative oxidoreductase